jgi:hypothetical protein
MKGLLSRCFLSKQRAHLFVKESPNFLSLCLVKCPLIITAFLFMFSSAFAQTNIDSVQQNIGKTIDKYSIDSLRSKLPDLPDSLAKPYYKVDSIRQAFNTKADSIQQEYKNALARVDAREAQLKHKVDSLTTLRLPSNKYVGKLDSLNQARQQTTQKFNSKLSDLKSKTTGKLQSLDLPPQYQEPINSLTKNVDGLSLNSELMKVSAPQIPGFTMPKVDGVGNLTSKAGEVANVGSLKSLPKLETPVGNLGEITQQAKGLSEDVKSISEGKLSDVKNIDKTIEQQASKVDGVAELQKQSGVVDGYKGQLDKMNDPEAVKQQAIEKAKEVAIDHFAGKEEQLKAAMQKMSKYKEKYSSVSSIHDLPKRPPNAMKGKPLIERLVPGFYFQYQQKNYNLFDFNPYLGYRISGRITSGLGWNQRYAYDRKAHDWNSTSRIFGPRSYADVRLGKGFIAHVETEVMNSFVPSTIRFKTGEGQREWVWSTMSGLKKEYKIYKNLMGTVLIQYNLFNRKYKAPYVDRLNSRIGFEYKLKKRRKVVNNIE